MDLDAQWARYYAQQFPDITALDTEDRHVSVREPYRGYFIWSWCARGVRLWRAGEVEAD